MGYMRHHAIVVTSWSGADVESAFVEAKRLFAGTNAEVSPPTPEGSNGYRSFFVAPDGSKEGWEESDQGNQRRSQFVAWMRTKVYEDGSGPLAWVEVQFGDEEYETKVTGDSDDARRTAPPESGKEGL
jgi:hypothetical protein